MTLYDNYVNILYSKYTRPYKIKTYLHIMLHKILCKYNSHIHKFTKVFPYQLLQK